VTGWLGVDVGGRRKGFDIALVDERGLLSLIVARSPYYAWVVEGLGLFGALARHEVEVIEVLEKLPTRTNQDQRDAIAAAVTARQHACGETETIGEIVVPAGRWG
jgi:hypothetical protein